MIVTILTEFEECACGKKKEDIFRLDICECPECHQIFCNECFGHTDNEHTIGCPKCGEELELPHHYGMKINSF